MVFDSDLVFDSRFYSGFFISDFDLFFDSDLVSDPVFDRDFFVWVFDLDLAS